MVLSPREYQKVAIDGSLEKLSVYRSCCLVSPTGSGKMLMGVETARKFRLSVWLNNRKDLIQQTKIRLIGYGVPDIPVMSIQGQNPSHYNERTELIVLDECHHGVSDQWQKAVALYPNAKILGLTASPERADGTPLSDLFQSMIVAANYSELLELGHLVPCRVFRPTKQIDRGMACSPVGAYKKYAFGMTGFCFVTTLKQAEQLKLEFAAEGILTAVVSSKTKKAERDQALELLASGHIRLIINCATMTEGVDVPSAQVCILARRCVHSGVYIQTTGRVLRPHSGKLYGVLLDLVGASQRHGFPTDDRDYSLSGTAIRKSQATPVRQCFICGAVMESFHRSCISCGTEFVPGIHKPPKIHNLALREVYAGIETPPEAKIMEFTRCLQTERWPWPKVKKHYESIFGESPPQAYWSELSSFFIKGEWTRLVGNLKFKLGAKAQDAASSIIKSYTGQWPSYNWRFE